MTDRAIRQPVCMGRRKAVITAVMSSSRRISSYYSITATTGRIALPENRNSISTFFSRGSSGKGRFRHGRRPLLWSARRAGCICCPIGYGQARTSDGLGLLSVLPIDRRGVRRSKGTTGRGTPSSSLAVLCHFLVLVKHFSGRSICRRMATAMRAVLTGRWGHFCTRTPC